MVKSETLRRILLSPRGGISAIFLLVVIICAVFAPLIAPYAYDIQSLRNANLDPSWKHWMGTDE
ncbi:MAG: D,D-dipeptide ABC transporter permease, partial [Bosea sp. (in: a-proteobacteria)]